MQQCDLLRYSTKLVKNSAKVVPPLYRKRKNENEMQSETKRRKLEWKFEEDDIIAHEEEILAYVEPDVAPPPTVGSSTDIIPQKSTSRWSERSEWSKQFGRLWQPTSKGHQFDEVQLGGDVGVERAAHLRQRRR